MEKYCICREMGTSLIDTWVLWPHVIMLWVVGRAEGGSGISLDCQCLSCINSCGLSYNAGFSGHSYHVVSYSTCELVWVTSSRHRKAQVHQALTCWTWHRSAWAIIAFTCMKELSCETNTPLVWSDIGSGPLRQAWTLHCSLLLCLIRLEQ